MKVLGIGEAVIDEISVIERKHEAAFTRIISTQRDAGGPVLSALTFLARMGAKCSFMTALGPDLNGDHIRKSLRNEKISLFEHGRSETQRNTILINKLSGQREKIRGVQQRKFIKKCDPDFIRSFDLIIFDRHEPDAFYDAMRAADTRTHVVIDPSTEVSHFTKDMMRQASHPIIPIESLVKLSKNPSLKNALDAAYLLCQKPFVVTLGEYGSLLYDGKAITLIAPLALRVIDTNGAGDVFRGAFAYGRLQNWDTYTCTAYANTVAALQCTKRGNLAALPDQKTILHYHAHAPRRSHTLRQVEAYFQELGGGL